MKRKRFLIPVGIILVLAIAYLLGPTMPKPEFSDDFPESPASPTLAAEVVAAGEAGIPNIRPGNASFIDWYNDSLKNPTDYVLLYLHGFSASPMEGHPVHVQVGEALGMNVYVPRLVEHGLETRDPLLNMTPDRLWTSTKEALSIALALGDQVIVMGTSTGGTLALKLAAEFPEKVTALVLCSPNVRMYDKSAALLSRPWGLQIARAVMGGDYRVIELDPDIDSYWYSTYRVESLVYLQQLIAETMKASVFQSVNQPVYTGYYYKDEENQDKTVSVEAIRWMFNTLGTPEAQKELTAFPEAGSHVICSDLTSGSWEDVQAGILSFLKEQFRFN